MTEQIDDSKSEREPLQNMLRDSLMSVSALRNQPISELQKADRFAVRSYQNKRLRQTHQDLVEDPRFGDAASFFFEEVYTETVAAWRDQQAIKALPKVSILMPLMALEPIAWSMRLDYLTEKLDVAIADRIRENQKDQSPLVITDELYRNAYATAGHYADRSEQIQLVSKVCIGLSRAAIVPIVGKTLSTMRMPARLLGLEDLQGFLERGLTAFKKLEDPLLFAQILLEREQEVSNRIFSQYAQGQQAPVASAVTANVAEVAKEVSSTSQAHNPSALDNFEAKLHAFTLKTEAENASQTAVPPKKMGL